jgi:four helix bundle protein
LLELETQVHIATLLNYIENKQENEFGKLIEEESKMLNALVNKIKE